MLVTDTETNLQKVFLQKYGKKDHSKDHHRICRELAEIVRPFLVGIPNHIYGSDMTSKIPFIELN